ncbi:hypothetical protein FB451DRAFT_1166629 [Mycena latifolia]|nr:hypothetical protein FB451DRAFT_1166629 [Mycena latifolia]
MPRNVKPRVGSYERDLADGHYTLKWNSLADMTAWLRHEETENTIQRAEDGCPCRLTIKTYPDTARVLGLYAADHSHPTGDENVVFTRIPVQTRSKIEELLRQGIRPDLVFMNGQGVGRIEKKIEAETVRLNKNDGLSTLEWVTRLRQRDSLMGFKATSDPPLPLTSLALDAFILAIQTPYQRKCYRKWGREFMGVDTTHSTTYYENMSLFTLIVRDRYDHSMPVVSMTSSNATEDTVDYFFVTFRRLNWEPLPAPPPVASSFSSGNRVSGGDLQSTTMQAMNYSEDPLLLDFILHKLQHLKHSDVVPSAALTESLRTLNNSLHEAVGDQMLLPNIKRMAPNTHSWPETATAMGAVIGASKKGLKK